MIRTEEQRSETDDLDQMGVQAGVYRLTTSALILLSVCYHTEQWGYLKYDEPGPLRWELDYLGEGSPINHKLSHRKRPQYWYQKERHRYISKSWNALEPCVKG